MSGENPQSPATSTTTTIHDLHPDVLTRTLLLLDGPTLAAACSATSHLRSLSSQSDLWHHLCLSSFPSLHNPLTLPFLSSPQSFFADIFPFPESFSAAAGVDSQLSGDLISAVDIFHRNTHIFSRVIQTETSSPWFRGSPFLIDAMDNEKPQQTLPLPGAMISPEELTLSWILIDTTLNRAVNVSTRRAVAIERNCYTGETMVRFATASAAGEKVIGAVVTCGEANGQIRDVTLAAEDIDGACLSGSEGLEIVRGMMAARRRGRGRWEEEAKERFLEFLRRKRRRKESRARREGVLDLCCTAVGVLVFLSFLSLIFFG